jgi:REP element-mobilizing transposase RayT
MSLHQQHNEAHQIYFCTITCYKWLPLFYESNAYHSVYKWFDHLIKDGCFVVGYVIMPNHLHVLLYPSHSGTSLNKLVGEGKRFMAYSIVSGLKKAGKTALLKEMEEGVEPKEKRIGKKHQVFRLSFDARICYNEAMVEQKLDYIHHNPANGKWSLVEDFTLYPHSSAGFYEREQGNKYVTHYKELGSERILASKSSESSDE